MHYKRLLVRTAVLLGLGLGLPLVRGGQGAGPALDVALVLDNSGSMKQNDPNRLMRDAVSAFTTGLEQNACLGLVLFADGARLVLPLTPVNEGNFPARINADFVGVDYSGRRTDIPAGVERAIYEIRQHGREGARRVIVLFTDGIVDVGNPAEDLERALWLRESLAQEARRLGIRVFGIAFTESADFELIQSIAQTTGGEYFRALLASDLPGVFQQIRSRIESTGTPATSPAPVLSPATSSTPAAAQWDIPVLWLALPLALVLVGAGVGIAALVAIRRKRSIPIPAARLVDVGGHSGQKFHPITKTVFRIGRDPNVNDLVLPQETVSARHAEIFFCDGMFYVRDLKSKNKTFLNGKQFSDPESVREAALKHRDRIRFDAYEFEFVQEALQGAKETVLAEQDAGGAELVLGPADGEQNENVVHSPPEPKLGEDQEPPKPAEEAKTILKPERCPRHKGLKATELCHGCGQAFCKYCVKEKAGRMLCANCLKNVA